MKPAQQAHIDIERAKNEDQLVREHLPLVQYVVSEVAHRVPSHVSRSDLVSAGMLGLAQAARSFDPERGIAFDRFASTRIRGALLDELRGRDWASRSVRARARGLQAAHEELTNKLGRTPKPEEVARMLDVADRDRAQARRRRPPRDRSQLRLARRSRATPSRSSPATTPVPRTRSSTASARRTSWTRCARCPSGCARRHRLLLRRAFDAGPRRRARRERVADLAVARRGAAVAEGRHELAARARRRAAESRVRTDASRAARRRYYAAVAAGSDYRAPLVGAPDRGRRGRRRSGSPRPAAASAPELAEANVAKSSDPATIPDPT